MAVVCVRKWETAIARTVFDVAIIVAATTDLTVAMNKSYNICTHTHTQMHRTCVPSSNRTFITTNISTIMSLCCVLTWNHASHDFASMSSFSHPKCLLTPPWPLLYSRTSWFFLPFVHCCCFLLSFLLPPSCCALCCAVLCRSVLRNVVWCNFICALQSQGQTHWIIFLLFAVFSVFLPPPFSRSLFLFNVIIFFGLVSML